MKIVTENEVKIRLKDSTGPKGDKGDKGEKGDPGERGLDYVLTEADKAEIAEIVAQKVPSGGGSLSVDENGDATISGSTFAVDENGNAVI